ncbi:MAG: DUF4249 domain-containing protein, partial [Salinimicrobium sp.]
SRTFPLEEDGEFKETGAEILVSGEEDVFTFTETEPGKYVSDQAFQAKPGVKYILDITTSEGKHYTSDPEELPGRSEIEDVYVKPATIDGESGLAILVDIGNPGETSGFYKYEFSETYKIVSPYQSIRDLYLIDGEFVEVMKTKQETVCYTTEESSELLLANTNGQVENQLDGFLVRFMNRENFRTAYRYSILVKQYAVAAETYSYYQTLKSFSGSKNLFSQNQLGLINGNISSLSDPEEPVVGIFSVNAVKSKRIFFNFEDFYDRNVFTPDVHVECEAGFPPTATQEDRETIGESLAEGKLKYLGFDPTRGYRFVKAGCVDCTVYGTNVPPDFWVE